MAVLVVVGAVGAGTWWWSTTRTSSVAAGVARYKNATLVDWNAAASEHPEWFGPDGTHIAFTGPASDTLSKLVANAVANG